MKILWIDCETTGLDPKQNDIVTLSCMVEIDGHIQESFAYNIQPMNWGTITEEALKVNGLTVEKLKTFSLPLDVHKSLVAILSKYVDRFKKNKTSEDKFICAGYNVLFDIQFLSEFWKKCGDNYFGSIFDYHKLDVASLVLFLKMHKLLPIEGYKLQTISEYLQIPIVAHNSTSDIEATRAVTFKLIERIKELK